MCQLRVWNNNWSIFLQDWLTINLSFAVAARKISTAHMNIEITDITGNVLINQNFKPTGLLVQISVINFSQNLSTVLQGLFWSKICIFMKGITTNNRKLYRSCDFYVLLVKQGVRLNTLFLEYHTTRCIPRNQFYANVYDTFLSQDVIFLTLSSS